MYLMTNIPLLSAIFIGADFQMAVRRQAHFNVGLDAWGIGPLNRSNAHDLRFEIRFI